MHAGLVQFTDHVTVMTVRFIPRHIPKASGRQAEDLTWQIGFDSWPGSLHVNFFFFSNLFF